MTATSHHHQGDAPAHHADPTSGVPALEADEAHVWHASLDLDASSVDRLVQVLSPDERARATRFARSMDRRRFVTARGVARILLGGYLDRPPSSLVFMYGQRGKPELMAPSGEAAVRFNYTHAGGRALFAIRRRGRIGVDLEAIRPLPDLGLLVRSVCTDGERAALEACADHERPAAFFRSWTRKEAMLKAMGDGLARPAASIEVRHAQSAERLLVAIDGNARAALRWSLRALPVAQGHVAALATEGADLHVCAWTFDGEAVRSIADDHDGRGHGVTAAGSTLDNAINASDLTTSP